MKVMLVFSGGLDSTTLLHQLIADGHKVCCVSFDYGQTHKTELAHAKHWTGLLGLDHKIVQLHGVFSGSALTGDKPMPHSTYSIETMKATVVPNRNMVMLSIATSLAIENDCDAVAYGCHAGDNDVYPDCRPMFVAAMRSAIVMCDWKKIELLTPFIEMTKRDIVNLARKLNVDLNKTWSCYTGGETPCGTCGSCLARQDAMK